MSRFQSELHYLNMTAISKALLLLPAQMDSLRSRAQLMKTSLQESQGIYRKQFGGGPARGLWQFELGRESCRSGVWGVFLHPLCRHHLEKLCAVQDVICEPLHIYEALAKDDVLAAGVARLNYWWNSAPLPDVHDEQGSWDYYNDTWHPGRPRRDTWAGYHRDVIDYLMAP